MSVTSATDSLRSQSSRPSVDQGRKSLSKRIGSMLFGTKNPHATITIEFDNEHKTYGPGETVSGTVILDVSRPLGVTHVVVCLYGEVEVFNSVSRLKRRSAGASRSPRGQGQRWVSEYYGDGFVSLFEEEVILCGEGRLDPKLYHFRFNVDFPAKLKLPSSIEFECGVISYQVRATVTRPTTIAQELDCERVIQYKEDINIATLPPPKPREVTLRPVSKDGHSKASLRRLANTAANLDSRRSQISVNSQPLQPIEAGGHTPRSVAAAPSVEASSRSSSVSRAASSLSPQSISSKPPASMSSARKSVHVHGGAQNIHTRVELTRSGCLPGQWTYVRISISNHHKILQNPKGVVVTLYRQARIDMHPNLPLGKGAKGDKYEDYYPRSKTGLGGLSLTSAGSSRAWRKDLAQTTSPLYIDPRTMSAELRVGIRVPDDAFSTIGNVPGQMMSFKYYVEVIIDTQGRLSLEDKIPSIVGVAATLQPAEDGQINRTDAQLQTMVFGTDCYDTTSLRREKHAVVVQCDVVIGTRDFNSGKGRAIQSSKDVAQTPLPRGPVMSRALSPRQDRSSRTPTDEDETDDGGRFRGYYSDWPQEDVSSGGWPEEDWADGEQYDAYYGYYDGYEGYADGYDDQHYADGYYAQWPDAASAANERRALQSTVPLPQMESERDLSEKERVRRHEASLLPSQPPDMGGVSSGSPAEPSAVPTAPALDSVGENGAELVSSDPSAGSTRTGRPAQEGSGRHSDPTWVGNGDRAAAPSYLDTVRAEGASTGIRLASAPPAGTLDSPGPVNAPATHQAAPSREAGENDSGDGQQQASPPSYGGSQQGALIRRSDEMIPRDQARTGASRADDRLRPTDEASQDNERAAERAPRLPDSEALPQYEG